MKGVALLFALMFSLVSHAHEGHHDIPTEPAKYGGILGNVTEEDKQSSLLKAELVRTEGGTVRVYLYDLKMVPVSGKGLSPEAKGTVDNRKAKTKESFVLKLNGDHYLGQVPKQKKRPFHIYLNFLQGRKKLFVAFDNLD